ncbi:MAG: PKD domain-containing protein [Thermoanaerobaculia bacterium]
MTSIRSIILFAAVLIVMIGAPVTATTLVLASDGRMVDRSDLVVIGTVTRAEAIESARGVWTLSEIAVEQTLKGTHRSAITVSEPGGRTDSRLTVVFGAPQYAPGERVLVFLVRDESGRYRTTDMTAGRFTEGITEDGRRLWERQLDVTGVRVIENGTAVESHARKPGGRVAAELEEFIRARASGIPAAEPTPAEAFSPKDLVAPDFALISEPSIHRWFAFQDGKTISWQSYGTQPGYPNGGTTELQSGMKAWTSYSSAKILYSYAGQRAGSPGGLTVADGINEVLFNDPLGEIPGKWNGSDGVIGTGGFNAVIGPKSWTSPFSADATHVQKSWSAYDIVEGNLVIQDGVSPAGGISSSSLAEILAHEFGHTLGLGHSSDSLALMHATLQDLGVFLRSDDQLAARWLYPAGDGSQPPPPAQLPPAAPSNLSLIETTSDFVRIRWDDNASDETHQTIYFQPSGESIRKFSDVPPNVIAANMVGLTPGRSYRVHVTAKNSSGESTPSNSIEFTVALPKLEAAFAVSPKTGTASITLFSFFDQSKGIISSRQWDFGNGSSSTSANPSHTFQQGGTFTVRLTVTSPDGQTSSSSSTIEVAPAPQLVADFTWSPPLVVASLPAQFHDRSLGSAVSWAWEFGDGTTSIERNPTKIFNAPGNHDVALTISNGLQISRMVRSVSVAASSGAEPALLAEFDASSFTPRVDQAVQFSDQSLGNPDSFAWTFGDGTKSTLRSPEHAWAAPGTYTVTLIARRGTSSSMRARSVIVREGARPLRVTLPVSAQTSGAGGTDWRTELTIHNAGEVPTELTLTWLPDPEVVGQTRSLAVAAGRTVVWARALDELFGVASGRGAITIEAVSDQEFPDVHIASRTFTSDDAGGSYGQAVGVMGEFAGTGNEWLTGLEWSRDYRTNIGWVNRSSNPARITFALTDSTGANLGERNVNAAPGSFSQTSLASLYDFLSTQQRSGLTLRVSSDLQGGVTSYASVIDNRSQDPVFIPATPQVPGEGILIPVVGKTAGGGGTFWRSDLSVFNPHASQLRVEMRFLRGDSDNRSAPWKPLDLSPRRSHTIRDVIDWLGEGSGSGTLELRWRGTGPVLMSRTYTVRDSDGGTFGQSIEPLPLAALGARWVITGLRSDAGFRTNLGLVNAGETAVGATLGAIRADGTRMAEAFVMLPPKSQSQWAAASLFPAADFDDAGPFTVVVKSTGAPTLFAYGSVVDRISGDPVYLGGN